MTAGGIDTRVVSHLQFLVWLSPTHFYPLVQFIWEVQLVVYSIGWWVKHYLSVTFLPESNGYVFYQQWWLFNTEADYSSESHTDINLFHSGTLAAEITYRAFKLHSNFSLTEMYISPDHRTFFVYLLSPSHLRHIGLISGVNVLTCFVALWFAWLFLCVKRNAKTLRLYKSINWLRPERTNCGCENTLKLLRHL